MLMTFPAAPQLPSPSTLTTSAKFMLPCLSHFIYFETAQTEDQSDFMIMLHAYPSPYRARALASGWSCLWIHGCTRGLGGGGGMCVQVLVQVRLWLCLSLLLLGSLCVATVVGVVANRH